MFYSARQLQDLLRGGGTLTLPREARLTPLAADWIRAKGIAVSYADVDAGGKERAAAASAARLAWWCDGPCAAAKAAITSLEKELGLAELGLPPDEGQLVEAVKRLAAEVKSGRVAGGVLLVKSGGAAVVYANRCPSLRAIMGTCLASVEDGIKLAAANVLVIEHPGQTLTQVRNMVSRFARGGKAAGDELKRRLAELSTCG